MARILLVEDDEIMRITLYDRLQAQGYTVDQEGNGRAALARIESQPYHLIVSDIRMPGLDGVRLLEETRRLAPETEVILMTAYGSVENAVECLRKGAADYILKPFDMDDLSIRVARLLNGQRLRARCTSLEAEVRPAQILGNSPVMQRLKELLARVAASDATVLITGASGTGKELAAAAIHSRSERAKGPYIKVNCGAIPEQLIESELFGHEKGAFTGATARQTGRFELADGGTLLLDEIGDLPLHLQVKLLRVLQEKEIERLGGKRPVRVDVRIIGATAKNLAEEVRQGRFREDLFYRLQVIPVQLPPLRDRREDIPLLCEHFLAEFGRRRGLPLRLSPAALGCLQAYDFPGNVRELRNILERASVLAPSPLIERSDLPGDLAGGNSRGSEEGLNLAAAVARAEQACILAALRQSGGNKTEAALRLGISRKNLWEKMKSLGLSTPA
ncbi:MAG: sigma-54-dependent Fis family transcriptional regulator [Desulfobulbaceae bacterium]|nr:sigma-54-dependent Fis family transcriptional regulator [Desulfobulbaceae bacterium]